MAARDLLETFELPSGNQNKISIGEKDHLDPSFGVYMSAIV
ncbi:MAG: hypothetical protein ACJAZW_002744 [Maritalea sp.]